MILKCYTVIQFFIQGKLNGNLKFPFEYVTKCATAAMGKPEAIICKIGTESSVACVSREKLRSCDKICNPSSKRIRHDSCLHRLKNNNF
jgi:hypothetical protein